MKLNSHISRYFAFAVLLHLLLALAPAMAQVRVGETFNLAVTPVPGDNYKWELYSEPTVPNFDFANNKGDESSTSYVDFVGGNSGASINVIWKQPGTYFFKVTASDITGCTNNLRVGMLEVVSTLTATIVASPAVCAGETVTLTVTLEGTPPWEYTYTDGTNSWTISNVLTSPSVITLTPGPVITTDYWITSVKDSYGTNTTPSAKATQQINPLPAPSTIYHR